jgi:hypothetical protein
VKKFISALLILIFASVAIGAGFNGSGTFVRTHNWTSDKNAGIKIDSGRMDAEDDGFATGLSTAITKDGQTTITANIPFNNKKITGLASGTARTDALNVGDLQDAGFVWGGTAAGTADVITFNLTPTITAYTTGMKVAFLSSGANTTNVTVNINAVGAVAITKNGATALVAGDIPNAAIVYVVYDGTQFQLTNPATGPPASETLAGDVELATQAEVNTGTDTTRSLTPATLKSQLTTPNPIGATTPSTGAFTTLSGTVVSGSTSIATAAGATITEFSTDGTMAGNSAVHVPTESAVKTYVDAETAVSITTTTYDVSTASGTVDITGAGFDPTFVEITYATNGSTEWGDGMSDGTTHYSRYTNPSGNLQANASNVIKFEDGTGDTVATAAMITDGIRLTWTKTSSPTGTIRLFVKFRR